MKLFNKRISDNVPAALSEVFVDPSLVVPAVIEKLGELSDDEIKIVVEQMGKKYHQYSNRTSFTVYEDEAYSQWGSVSFVKKKNSLIN